MIDFSVLLDAHYGSEKIETLTKRRSIATIPFFGNYKLIDFILSNINAAGGKSVALFPNNASTSLHDHVANGQPWDLKRTKEGIFYFQAIKAKIHPQVLLSYKRIYEHLEYLEKTKSKYILLADCRSIVNFSIQQALLEHQLSSNEISLIKFNHQTTNYYIINREVLIKLAIEYKSSNNYGIVETVNRNRENFKIGKIDFESNYYIIDSLERYYYLNMDLLKEFQVMKQLFKEPNLIRTKPNFYQGAQIETNSFVRDSLISNGSKIKGEVTNSILFKRIIVERDAIVRNSIIFAGVKIEPGAILENVIADKNCLIKSGVIIKGTKEKPVFLNKGTVYEKDILWK